jgi:glutamate---cysteine ligase / carboxylate-amine ligase
MKCHRHPKPHSSAFGAEVIRYPRVMAAPMLAREQPSFTFGIEEEYFLVSPWTRALVSEPPTKMFDECKAALGDQFSAEYQRSQIEVATRICTSMSDARAELGRLRNVVAAIASRFGLTPIAASTHPFTPWSTQRHTDKQRYNTIADDLKGLGRRMVIGGMHVHVGIDDDEQRIAVMNGIRSFLPLLLALSTSSPFWQGEDTGLKSYRTAINDATPRKGMPECFASWGDYSRTLETLVRSGVIEDATKIWWDLRPSARFPTLELRITDSCPLIDDALCIAALFRCLCRCLHQRNRDGRHLPSYPLLLLNENRWRAQRYGLDDGFINLRREEMITSAVLLDELLALIQEDAEFFDSKAEVDHARIILARGTSADRQLALYRHEADHDLAPSDALRTVVDQLVIETLVGTDSASNSNPRRVLFASSDQLRHHWQL